MDVTTLEKGLELHRKINQCSGVINCFEWRDSEGNPSGISTNPRIIIKYDGCDGREEQEIPFELNAEIIAVIKRWTIQQRDQVVMEFNSL